MNAKAPRAQTKKAEKPDRVSLYALPTDVEPSHSHNLDRMIHAALGRYSLGISPASIIGAYIDWLTHLASAPGKQKELVEKMFRKSFRLMLYALQSARDSSCPTCIEPLIQDRRFNHADWQKPPFSLIYQAFLLIQQWWFNATTEVRGVTRHHEQIVTFVSRQLLDMFSPSNFITTNPEVLDATIKTMGANLVQGATNWWEDWMRLAGGRRPEGSEKFEVGTNVAITPGKVIFRNELIELIQYAPQTTKVFPEPVLVVPSWIMKYYILDLSPHNSLVNYLVGQGHTVYVVSWKNPDARGRDLGMADYLRNGVMQAIDVVSRCAPKIGIHGVGYCLGGTILAIIAAAMARDNVRRLKTLTLLASEIDFTEPGELSLFIDESQLAYLEDIMWDQGYLDGKQMSGAFQLLNSRDLVLSRIVHDYLMGTRAPLTDLMAWNADATRMPYRMHGEYLRSLYLDNDLAEGRYTVDGRPVALSDIRVPIFCVATQRDHVSPWRSVFKLHLLTDTGVTFLLTSGGHNVGIVNPPGVDNRSYQVSTWTSNDNYVDPETWVARVPVKEGSWWPEWQSWLEQRSGKPGKPPAIGSPANGYVPLRDAPGEYVLAP